MSMRDKEPRCCTMSTFAPILTRIGVSCPPRSSTTASRRDTRGGRMQTELDATCIARVLPERPSPYPPSLFFARSSFSFPYLQLLFAVAISSCQTPGSFLLATRECTARTEGRQFTRKIQDLLLNDAFYFSL